ncbi:MAG: universal stress protein [Nitrospirae bacterium]|nr:universal stress protein [Nitrospirota bacterium]
MSTCRCIVTGIDLGPDTEKVVAYTSYIASKTHAPVRLIYVIDYLLTPPSYISSYIEEEKKRDEAEMSVWKKKLLDMGIQVESGVILGRLHESFVRVIEESAPELLSLGFKNHLMRPSSSERLIKSLNLPMLVVRGEMAEKASVGNVTIRKILCPVDFSDNAGKAVVLARKYAGLFSADLRLVHIVPPFLPGEKPGEKEQEMLSMRSEAGTKMESLCREMGIGDKGEIYEGNPAEMISSIAGESGYDLIVMGARGLSYVQGILIGSTTDAVLKTSPCPLLIVR